MHAAATQKNTKGAPGSCTSSHTTFSPLLLLLISISRSPVRIHSAQVDGKNHTSLPGIHFTKGQYGHLIKKPLLPLSDTLFPPE